MNYDIYLVGVGGQGILTLGEILTEAAVRQGIAASFYPSKGMAQRGGFVRAQLRLGRATVGPNIPPRGADLAISVERSEALKAIRFVRPGGDLVLYGDVWAPTAVMLDKAPYPTLAQVREQALQAQAHWLYVDPAGLPRHNGQPVPDNVFVLGVVLGHTRLREVLDPAGVQAVVQTRWKRGAERNLAAFQGGLQWAPARGEEGAA